MGTHYDLIWIVELGRSTAACRFDVEAQKALIWLVAELPNRHSSLLPRVAFWRSGLSFRRWLANSQACYSVPQASEDCQAKP